MENNNENINQETVPPTENKEKKKKNKGLKIALIVFQTVFKKGGHFFQLHLIRHPHFLRNG